MWHSELHSIGKKLVYMIYCCKLNIFLTCLLIILGSPLSSSQIVTVEEKIALVEMLQEAGLDSTDVCFLKDWDASTKFKLSSQVESLNNPWKFIELLQTTKDKLNQYYPDATETFDNFYSQIRSYSEDFDYLMNWQYDPLNVHHYHHDFRVRASEIKKPADCIIYVNELFDKVNYYLQEGFADLSDKQLDSLSCWLYGVWAESEDSLDYKQFLAEKYPGIGTNLSMGDAIRLLEKVRLESLTMGWWVWSRGLHKLQYRVNELKFTSAKPKYYNTRWGTMIIGGTGNDRYPDTKKLRKNPVSFILEPGGNDIYECAFYTDRKHPFYIAIDLKGNDYYCHPGIAKGNSVLAGYGYLQDAEGDDVYSYGDFAFSAMLGSQTLIDKAGNDTYKSGLFTQAAAMFGISVLNDIKGNDTYTATQFAQGFGSTQGLGLLLDESGNDVYYTGGKYLHKPLAPFDYRSMAQGFGFGLRPDLAGGIGILYDGAGNDRYCGGVYAQGVAYWYAMGLLIDEKGNDYYDAVYYPQGSGIHLANGALIDMEGEDHYYSKHGPGQGNGHDWSVGVFIDRKGNDHYSVEGGNGLGLTNSVGIFLDAEGNDKYEHRNPSNYGYANFARETGGIGLFLDAGGKDAYPDTTKVDNKTWQQGTYGIGRDTELNIPVQTKVEELAEQAVAEVDSLAAIDKLFAIASEWEVGSAVNRVRQARKYLLDREQEAVEYAVKHKLGTKSGLEYRALSELAKNSELMVSKLYAALQDTDSLKVKNSIALLSEKADSTLADSLAVFLQHNKYIPTVLSALGYLKTGQSLAMIQPWLQHQTEKYRYLAARSLKVMNTPESMQLLREMRNNSSFLIKAMVRQLPKE